MVTADNLSGDFVRTTTVVDGSGATVATDETIAAGATWTDALAERTTVTIPAAVGPARTLTIERTRSRSPSSLDPMYPAVEDRSTTLRGGARSVDYDWTYNAGTRTARTTSPLGRITETVLDDRGRLVELRQPGLLPMQLEYDLDRGRVHRVWAGAGAQMREVVYGYQDASVGELWSPASITAGSESTVVDWESSLGSDTFLPRVLSVSTGSSTVSYSYDGADRVSGVIPPGRTSHGLVWRDDNRLDSYVPPALAGAVDATQWDYDAAGLLDDINRAGDFVDFQYAADGRLTRAVFAEGSTDYGYDASGLPATLTVQDGQVVTLTADGPLTTSVTWSGAGRVNGAVTFGYDELWQVNQLGAGGRTARYSYDDDGALDCLTADGSVPNSACAGGLAVDVLLDGTWSAHTRYPGNATAASYVETDVDVSGFGETSSSAATWHGPSNDGSFTLSYSTRDARGRIRSYQETSVGSGGTAVHAIDYSYDDRGHLTDVWRDDAGHTGAPAEHYEYGANGVRTRATVSGVEVSAAQIQYDARDRLSQYGDLHFAYDSAGQLQRMERWSGGAPVEVTTYDYDALGNLRRVDLPDARVIAYRVDGAGRRVERTIDGVVTHRWLYLDSLRPVAELDGSNVVQAVLVYANGPTPELVFRGGQIYRLITDHVGSVRRVVDATTGQLVGAVDYDSFGNVSAGTESAAIHPFGFAGGLADPLTGLVHFGMRDYAPRVGRWTSSDPALFNGGDTDLYAYCGGDPVNCVDRTGLLGTDDAQFDRFASSIEPEDRPALAQAGIGAALVGIEAPAAAFVWMAGLRSAFAVTNSNDAAGHMGMAMDLAGGYCFEARGGAAATPELPLALRGGEAATHVYFGVRAGNRVYVGITKNLIRRQAQHGSRFRLEAITRSPLTRGEARAVEQALINRNPGFENLINSISPKHAWYDDAVAWGEAWLRANGL